MLQSLRFQNFNVVYRADRWFRARLTGTGSLVASLFGASALFAINTRASLCYQISMMTLALLAAAVASALTFRGRFEVERRLPRYASVGVPFTCSVLVTNHTDRLQAGLTLRERLAPGAPDLDEFFRTRAAEEERRNWFDRKVGYPRWAAFMRLHNGAEVAPAAIPSMTPGAQVRVDVPIKPLRRGHLHLGGHELVRPDPLGLFNARLRVPQGGSVLVLPRCYPVSWRSLVGAAPDLAGGTSASAKTDGSGEFAGLREYRPGDPLRLVHWKGWARHRVPIVKELHEESFARQAVLLDTRRPASASQERFEAAVCVAASFARAGADAGVEVEHLFLGARAIDAGTGPRRAAADRMLAELACVRPHDDASPEAMRGAVMERADRFGGCVCVLLEFDASRERLITGLRDRGVDVLVVVVCEAGKGVSGGGAPVAGLAGWHEVPADAVGPSLAAIG